MAPSFFFVLFSGEDFFVIFFGKGYSSYQGVVVDNVRFLFLGGF